MGNMHSGSRGCSQGQIFSRRSSRENQGNKGDKFNNQHKALSEKISSESRSDVPSQLGLSPAPSPFGDHSPGLLSSDSECPSPSPREKRKEAKSEKIFERSQDKPPTESSVPAKKDANEIKADKDTTSQKVSEKVTTTVEIVAQGTQEGKGLPDGSAKQEGKLESKKEENKPKEENKKDNKSKGEEKGDNKSKGEEKGDNKSKGEEKSDSKSKGEEKSDSKSKEEQKGDNKSKKDGEGDRKSKEKETEESKSNEQGKGDNKSKEEEKGDNKSKEETKGDNKSKDEEKGDDKSKEETNGDNKSKEDEKGDNKSKVEKDETKSKQSQKPLVKIDLVKTPSEDRQLQSPEGFQEGEITPENDVEHNLSPLLSTDTISTGPKQSRSFPNLAVSASKSPSASPLPSPTPSSQNSRFSFFRGIQNVIHVNRWIKKAQHQASEQQPQEKEDGAPKDGKKERVPITPDTLKEFEETLCIPPPELTDRQKQLLRKSWTEIGNDISQVGVIAFTGLFDAQSESDDAFLPFQSLSSTELSNTAMLREHALRVMNTVEKFVHRVDYPEKMQAILEDLGKSHFDYKIKVEYIDIVGMQFVRAVKPHVSEWTPELEEAWTAMVKIMTFHISRGMVNTHEELLMASA